MNADSFKDSELPLKKLRVFTNAIEEGGRSIAYCKQLTQVQGFCPSMYGWQDGR